MAQTRSGINRALMWLRRTLEITEQTDSPQVLSEELRPVIDVFGWERAANPVHQIRSNPGATTAVALDAVPEGEAHYFLSCAISHDDPVGSKDMTILFADRNGLVSQLTSTAGVAANFFRVIERPILVGPGARLQGLSRNAIAGGSNFLIQCHFIVLPIGEYFSGSPYG